MLGVVGSIVWLCGCIFLVLRKFLFLPYRIILPSFITVD
jgi:hypothetical protein